MRLVCKIASCLYASSGKGIEVVYAIKPIALTNIEAEGDDHADGGSD
jgi:hypothetical protein